MKKNIILILSFIGMIGFLAGCEKDETKVVMLENPVLPSIVSIPDLSLVSTKAKDTLIFVGTPVDPGFVASADYYLEACVAGTGFLPGTGTIRVYFGKQDTRIALTVEALNKLFLKKFPAGVAGSLDLRIRSQLKLDAGTGALGTSASPLEYISEIKSATVTTY